MTVEKKSVISTRDLTGVVAKLNAHLNRSADAQSIRTKPVSRKTDLPVRAIARKLGFRRDTVKSVIGRGIGTYTFRLLAESQITGKRHLGVACCAAQNENIARTNLADHLRRVQAAEIGRSLLLRYEPMSIEMFAKFEGSVDLSQQNFEIQVDAAA
jgi:hypothetical protein